MLVRKRVIERTAVARRELNLFAPLEGEQQARQDHFLISVSSLSQYGW